MDMYEFNKLNEFYNDKLFDSSIGCIKGIDSVVIKKSHHYKSRMAILDFYKSGSITKLNSLTEIYNSIITVKYYTHPYYRSKLLIAVFLLQMLKMVYQKHLNLVRVWIVRK